MGVMGGRIQAGLALAIVFGVICPTASIEIEVSKAVGSDGSTAQKCISEDLHAHVISLVHFDPDAPIIFKVLHPNSTVLHEGKAKEKGHWGFLAPTAGEYRVCFQFDDKAGAVPPHVPLDIHGHPVPPPPQQQGGQLHIAVDWKTGINAKDWDAVAKREHLNEIVTQLTEVEHELRHVYSEMMRMREREEEMRNMSEAVNARVAWMSVASLCVTGLLSIWQVFHLHAYFKKKKIL